MSTTDQRPRLNLEQQRKRAKELRHAHREGRLDAAERIRVHLPRAQARTEAEVLAAPFSLSEAQLVVAREAGFASWPRLKRQSELERAGGDGALEALLDAALAGAPITDPGLARRSLTAAATLGDAAAALPLIDQQAATARGGLRQWTPLHYCCAARHGRGDPAIAAGRVQIAARLLALGADPNEAVAAHDVPGGFRSVLQAAVREAASAELVGLLLDAGAALVPPGGGAGPPLPLTDTVTGGSLACLERMLAAGPEPWTVREALEVAVHEDRADMVKLLLAGGEPSKAGRWWGHGGSCLHAAILLGRGADMLETLLASDVDLAATDRDGRTAYQVAARTGHDPALALLRTRGAAQDLDDVDRVIAACVRLDPEARRLAQNPSLVYRYTDHLMLGWAVRHRPAAVPLLLEARLDPNVADPEGETPLHLAADLDTIAALRVAGANPAALDHQGRTPQGAPPPPEEQRERDELFERAADAVAFGDLATLAELLDEEPALVHWRSSRAHRSTLLLYCGANGTEDPRQRSPDNAASIAQLLLDRGADPNAAGRLYGGGIGATTLAMVLTSGFTMESSHHGALVRVLVRGGARLDLWEHPRQAMLWALEWGAHDSVLALAEGGLPLDDLLFAAAANRVDLLAELLARGADVNHRHRGGLTALHAAALAGHTQAVTFLLAHGADATARDDRWHGTAAEKAHWRGHDSIAALIHAYPGG
jgi:ankyrin repeat protein